MTRYIPVHTGWWSGLVPMATLCAIGAWLFTAQCAERPAPGGMGASVAWDGRGYAVAWGERASRGRTKVLAARFYRGSGEFSTPRSVAVVDGLEAAPELVAGASGYLMVLDRGDAGLSSMALTGDFSPRGGAAATPIVQSAATLCTSPIWSGRNHGVAWWTKDKRGDVGYHLAHIDEDGQVLRTIQVTTVSGLDPACALAQRDGVFYLALAVGIDSQRGGVRLLRIDEHGAQTVVADVSAYGPWRGPLIESDEVAPPMRLGVDGRGFLLLYRNLEDGRAHVSRLDHDGEPVAEHGMPGHVHAATADMVGDERGWSLAWSAGDHVVWSAFDDDAVEQATWRSSKRPAHSALRMSKRGEECVAVWTELQGRYVWIFWARHCLGAAGEPSLAPGHPGQMAFTSRRAP